jgi:hypothetical protein
VTLFSLMPCADMLSIHSNNTSTSNVKVAIQAIVDEKIRNFRATEKLRRRKLDVPLQQLSIRQVCLIYSMSQPPSKALTLQASFAQEIFASTTC